MTPEVVRAGVQRSLDRLGVSTIDLLQFHWWSFEHSGYLDAMKELAVLQREGKISELGVTNFDTDHLRVLVKHGIPVVSNQVCFSLLDPRPAGDMSAFCREYGIKLLAYGTLGGGFLGDRWLGAPRPRADDWSKMKYLRFVDAIGGWETLQAILTSLAGIARKHAVSIANVATRWVLDQPAVAAIIVGARLGEREHRADNVRLGSLALDDDDRAALERALARRLRRRVSTAALSHGIGGPEPPSRQDPLGLQIGCNGSATRPPTHRFRQRLGAGLRLQPRHPGRRPDSGQRHHRDARQRRGGLPRRRRGPDRLHPRQDRGQPRSAWGLAR
jgi:aryl-alcohol dehydrogenase-like predicted oxidoreductase